MERKVRKKNESQKCRVTEVIDYHKSTVQETTKHEVYPHYRVDTELLQEVGRSIMEIKLLLIR